MAAYKDEERGTWYVSFYYEDWTGAKKRKVKRGFRTKKEALNFEAEYKRTAKADMDMTMGEFVEVYFRDKSQSLKDRSIKNKRDTMKAQLLPYFKDRPMTVSYTHLPMISFRCLFTTSCSIIGEFLSSGLKKSCRIATGTSTANPRKEAEFSSDL